jgi:general secretion pathway protein G
VRAVAIFRPRIACPAGVAAGALLRQSAPAGRSTPRRSRQCADGTTFPFLECLLLDPRLMTSGPHDARSAEAGFSMVELMIVLVFIGIIAGIASSYCFYAFDVSRVGRTVANLRGVADALVKYQSDNSVLPPGGMQPVSAIAPALQPSGGRVAQTDGWDNPIYYTPFTTAQGVATFRLYSYGKDGAADGVVTGTWVDFSTDIVVEGGSFIQTKW